MDPANLPLLEEASNADVEGNGTVKPATEPPAR
jgi:hypothetical protein